MKLVIVESPAKAKTINKYLGSGYNVIASYGHVRDLPSKSGAVDVENNYKLTWDVDARSQKHVRDLVSNAKKADEILLATDPDREGEAISWHIVDILKEKKVSKPLQRVVFYEITKKAVQQAIENPRNINQHLVDAYLGRRTLDYLMGFTLSPVLWRKLPGSRSAGRVQSVALRVLAERENEIELFTPQEYWSLDADFTQTAGEHFPATLSLYEGNKLEKFSVTNTEQANKWRDTLLKLDYSVDSIEKKRTQRKPLPPFTTSTLQQEASKRLGFAASRTMRIAQKLYEGVDINGQTQGLITYMRTDSFNLAQDAIKDIRNYITSTYKGDYLSSKAIQYTTKSKNAQEAHEAIRPTNFDLSPQKVKGALEIEQFKLYELIWNRAIACQMSNAQYDRMTVMLASTDKAHAFKTTGSRLVFDGFLKVFEDEETGENKSFKDVLLPALEEGMQVKLEQLDANQHFTQPPPRYSEASLIKTLEEMGIGRPSTYSSIIQVLQDRKYATLENKRFYPTDRGRLVTAFLVHYFKDYVDYNFTADLEESLDKISNGDIGYHTILDKFWKGLDALTQEALKLKISDMLEILNNELAFILFPKKEDGTFDRKCPKCDSGELSLKVGRYGAFVGCSNYPECKFTRPFDKDDEASDPENEPDENKELGKNPEGHMVHLKKGPYGWYVEVEAEKKKRTSLPKTLAPDNVDLNVALDLLQLPRELGKHPETGKKIVANIGRFGPYVQHEKLFASLKKDDNVLSITHERALELITEKEKAPKRPRRAAKK